MSDDIRDRRSKADIEDYERFLELGVEAKLAKIFRKLQEIRRFQH